MSEHIGRYQILEQIGRGAMGMIFKAHDPALERVVALKVVSPQLEVTPELRSRFLREAKAAAQLTHPNIVTVHDIGEDRGQLFIVMELLTGEELRSLIARRQVLTVADKLSIIVQLCAGLYYAHRAGVVHRDVKPANIFVLRNGTVKILDFGIAYLTEAEDRLTRTGVIVGTFRYMAPEQLQGRRVDARSDMFAVGAVSYELLSLRPAFTGENVAQLLEQIRTADPPPLDMVDPSISSRLAAIVHRAMQKDPAERFADLDQMRRALSEVSRSQAEPAGISGSLLVIPDAARGIAAMPGEPIEQNPTQTNWPDFMSTLEPGPSQSPVSVVVRAANIEPPRRDVPPDKARWSGRWSGWAWANQLADAKLIVERVTAESAIMVYGIASASRAPTTVRLTGNFVGDELRARYRDGATIAFRMRPEGQDIELMYQKEASWYAGILSREA